MRRNRPISALRPVVAVCLLAAFGPASPSARAADVPPWLPRYDLDVTIDAENCRVHLKQRVTWTNRHRRPANELVFNVYPRYTIPKADVGLIAKTLELLRVAPHESMELGVTPPGEVTRVTWVGQGAAPVPAEPLARVSASSPADPGPQPCPVYYQEELQTALVVPLPRPVGCNEAVTVELEYTLRLPNKMGRWGSYGGVITLANWSPVLAFYDDGGWQPLPFIPWHQPFYNEAGVYRARINHPATHVLGCTAPFAATTELPDGRRLTETAAVPARDFAVLASVHYQEYTAVAPLPDGRQVTVRCLAFREHEHYGRECARIAAEAVSTYSKWLGPYPYPQLTIAESYFGWNGNECSGLIMIDERVFGMPRMGQGYVEYLVSHETCHQWWYNVIGTNGYCETFMDEGMATYLTHRWMDRKLGKKNTMVTMPKGLEWLPSVTRENYRWASFFGAVGRKECGPTVAPIPEYGNVVQLFTAAYDRGSKVVGMVEERLGEAAFIDFLRCLHRKYHFRVLRVADFQKELEAYTGQSWEEFFRRWVYGKGMTDWCVEDVATRPDAGGCRVTVTLKQKGDNTEQTVVGFCLADTSTYQVRVPVLPQAGVLDLQDPPGKVVCLGPDRFQVDVTLPSEPAQVTVDPDKVLIDTEPANNHWKRQVRYHVTPLFTMLDEADLTLDYDKLNVVAGPWVYGATFADPWYTRSTMIGLRAGVYRTAQFNAGVFTAFRSDYRDVVVGADFLVDHWPGSHTQIGGNFERRVATPIGTDAPNDVDRAVLFFRKVFQYGSSLYLPPMHYVEAFGSYQDNALPFARTFTPGAVRPDSTSVAGVHYRIDYRTPYWDPEAGFRFDATYAGGSTELDKTMGYHSVEVAGSVAHRLDERFGPLCGTNVAARAYGAAAFPNRGQYFALGGSSLYRGYDLAERQGSALWVLSAEARVPLVQDARQDYLDKVVGLRTVQLAAFYDVGEVYADGRSVGGVAHALGAGVRLDFAVFSFIERSVVRFDVAKTVNDNSPLQFWLAFQQPF